MLNEILITEHPNSYRVTFPYKHQIGWHGFKQAGMWFKKSDNVGGIEGQVYWCIPKAKLQAALDVIQYWYTEHPLIGQSAYGVRVQEAATDTKPAHTHSCPTCQVVFPCDLPICKDWPFDVRCAACFAAGDKASAIVEATPRTPVKPYPNGVLISPSLLAMQGAEFYGSIMI